MYTLVLKLQRKYKIISNKHDIIWNKIINCNILWIVIENTCRIKTPGAQRCKCARGSCNDYNKLVILCIPCSLPFSFLVLTTFPIIKKINSKKYNKITVYDYFIPYYNTLILLYFQHIFNTCFNSFLCAFLFNEIYE